MKKIPTLFVRNPDDRKHVLPEVNPECKWVLDGEGVATRKYDGTCIKMEGGRAYARREVKPGKQPPPNFEVADHDDVTGKTVGWEPAEQSSFWPYITEALDVLAWPDGTYELVGPKVNGNPEDYDLHRLIQHGAYHLGGFASPESRTYDALRTELTGPDWPGWEGIVFHHPDGRMAKIKVRDFPAVRAVARETHGATG